MTLSIHVCFLHNHSVTLFRVKTRLNSKALWLSSRNNNVLLMATVQNRVRLAPSLFPEMVKISTDLSRWERTASAKKKLGKER